MTDLRAAISTLKATLDKQPKDSNSRPFHAALVECFEAVADGLEQHRVVIDGIAGATVASIIEDQMAGRKGNPAARRLSR